jgi:hypothetical protein
MTVKEFIDAVAEKVEEHSPAAEREDIAFAELKDSVWTLGLKEAELRACSDRNIMLLLASHGPASPLSEQSIETHLYRLSDENVAAASEKIRNYLIP